MHSRMILLVLSAFLAMAGTAFAQDPEALPNPLTMGKGPKPGDLVPSWIFYWMLGISTAVVLSLVGAIKVLWAKVNEEEVVEAAPGLSEAERTQLRELHELHSVKDEDGVPRWYMPRALLTTVQGLRDTTQEIEERLKNIDQNRQDRQTMRIAFESEKTEMRTIYTEEIKTLQGKLSSEQEGRREETQQLWKQNNQTTREVMTVIKDMIVALENSTKVIEQWAPELDE